MHLHYLRELSDRFEIAAICDLSEPVRTAVGREYGVDRQLASWQDLVAEPLDAVLVLTSGSHAPPAIAPAGVGPPRPSPKPMCFPVAEGQGMGDAVAPAASTSRISVKPASPQSSPTARPSACSRGSTYQASPGTRWSSRSTRRTGG